MQPQANAPDGTAVPSQTPDLEARIRSLETEASCAFHRADGLERKLNQTIDLVDDVVAAQTASTKLYGAIERLLVDVSKPPGAGWVQLSREPEENR